MPNYQTSYPIHVTLYDGREVQLNFNDNQNRVLVVETNTSLNTLEHLFVKEGFTKTTVEEKKPYQISQGMNKRLTEDWDMHLRFLQLHKGFIALDAEVETSREYIEHINGKWISVIYEITTLLDKYAISWGLWYKSTKNYVKSIIQNGTIILDEVASKVEWKPLAIGAVAGITLGLILKGLFDSDEEG